MSDVDALEERPALSRAWSARALDELVGAERARQDARLAVLRRLRGEADDVLAPGAGAGSTRRGWRGRVGAALRRRAAPERSERALRARYEEAQLRARRAAAFAETLGELAREIVTEGDRLRALLADMERDDQALDALFGRLRVAAAEGAAGAGRVAEARAEKLRRRADEVEALRDAVRAGEDRVLRLVEGERMVLARVDALRADVERTAQQAARQLDDVGEALRALATADDAERVLADLDDALRRLFGSLDESARRLRDSEP